mmetsp:Transcript_35977/g.88641  ORF Transcript_35977/g.88641 Transcript_35977/m.88641 type:complete len:247 (-) Transcript_35977:1218-1958(-)
MELRLPRSMYSRMMVQLGALVHAPSHSTMEGWRSLDRMDTSERNSRMPCSASSWLNNFFTATGMPPYCPRNTSPNPPCPMRFSLQGTPLGAKSISLKSISHSSLNSKLGSYLPREFIAEPRCWERCLESSKPASSSTVELPLGTERRGGIPPKVAPPPRASETERRRGGAESISAKVLPGMPDLVPNRGVGAPSSSLVLSSLIVKVSCAEFAAWTASAFFITSICLDWMPFCMEAKDAARCDCPYF